MEKHGSTLSKALVGQELLLPPIPNTYGINAIGQSALSICPESSSVARLTLISPINRKGLMFSLKII